MHFEAQGSQGLESLSIHTNGAPSEAPVQNTPIGLSDQHNEARAEPEDIVPNARFGVAVSPGGRGYQDDRSISFSTRLENGRRITVAALLDGHHGHHLSELIATYLPYAFQLAIKQNPDNDMFKTLSYTIRALDDKAFDAFITGAIPTGGTTIILHAILGNEIYTANLGDCKSVLSSKGAPDPLSEAHNPPVESERLRFTDAGIPCFSDHIGGSDINVCRTIGDYDLGSPLKWRDDDGIPRGPLICDPEITLHTCDPIDEFIVVATDGLWDYFTPESSVITGARRQLRASNNDAQVCAEWLLKEALQRQRMTLHEGTPGDNVTVMVVQIRPLPELPRMSGSRLSLRRTISDIPDTTNIALYSSFRDGRPSS